MLRATLSLPSSSPTSVALVTGASAGIGSDIARELARRGHNTVLVARREDRLRELAAELEREHGTSARALACDLSDPEAVDGLPGRVQQLGFEVDVLVNNAGFATGGPFHDSDAGREREQVRVLVEAVVVLTRAFLPAMVQRRRGAILNVASTAGMQPMPYSAGYSAAKAYVLTFSEALHHEVRGHGVTVTALCPGPVETDFWQQANWQTVSGKSFEQAVPGPARITSAEAARAGIDGLAGGKRVVVPGLPMRGAMMASRYIPHMVKLPAIEWAMRRRS
jgi:short-subunit dehydrogenase